MPEPLPPLPSWPELTEAVESAICFLDNRDEDSQIALRTLLAHMKAFPTAAERMAAIHYQSKSCLAVYECGEEKPEQEDPPASEDLGLAIHELLDPLNYLELNQESAPARETGDEVSPTGHSAPSSPGAVHSKEPWAALPYTGSTYHIACYVTSPDGTKFILAFGGEDREQVFANRDRVLACVNAMASVPDPEKLMAAVRKLVEDNLNSTDRTFVTINQDGVADIAAAMKGDD